MRASRHRIGKRETAAQVEEGPRQGETPSSQTPAVYPGDHYSRFPAAHIPPPPRKHEGHTNRGQRCAHVRSEGPPTALSRTGGGRRCVHSCPRISRRAIANAPRPLLRRASPIHPVLPARTLLLNRCVQRRYLFGGELAPLAARQVAQLDGAEAVAVQRQDAVLGG